MMGRTHLLMGGTAAGIISIAAHVPTTDAALFTGAALVGSLLPDADDSGSLIHKRTKLEESNLLAMAIGFVLRIPLQIIRIFPHRGMTHWPPFAVLPALLCSLLSPILGLGMLFGYIVHLFGDSLTPKGIPGWPLARSLHLLPYGYRIETGYRTEALFALSWSVASAMAVILLVQ